MGLRARIRIVPTPWPATRRSTSVTSSRPSAMSDRSSALLRAATASTAPARSASTRLASSAFAAARTISGRPCPIATAPEIASRASRSTVSGVSEVDVGIPSRL